jgi:hypothetical protein
MRDRLLVRTSLAVIAGILLSGPLGLVVVEWLAQEPLWNGRRDVRAPVLASYRPTVEWFELARIIG